MNSVNFGKIYIRSFPKPKRRYIIKSYFIRDNSIRLCRILCINSRQERRAPWYRNFLREAQMYLQKKE